MTEKIYDWEEFKDMLYYLEFETEDILDFYDYYQNLNIPSKNLEDFIKFIDIKKNDKRKRNRRI